MEARSQGELALQRGGEKPLALCAERGECGVEKAGWDMDRERGA